VYINNYCNPRLLSNKCLSFFSKLSTSSWTTSKAALAKQPMFIHPAF
jgi:hypothetical protein